MSSTLDRLTKADVRARCTEASFERGRSYYTGGAVRQRVRLDDGIETRAPADLQAALTARSKEELVAVLADVCAVYPHLVDEFGLLGEPAEYDPEAVVAEIFADLDPPGGISADEGVARMETVARHAARLARQDQGEVARRAYYALTSHCVGFCEAYGADDIFPSNIPYDFAVAYQDLALAQLEEGAEAIEAEVQDMLQGDWAPEMLGIKEPLMKVWDALEL